MKFNHLVRFSINRNFLSLICMLLLVGCGTKDVPIEGTITLDGEPLAGVQILFDQPDKSPSNSFSGRTAEDGHYVLKSISEELSSPVAGTYRVSLTTSVPDRDATESDPMPKERIPKKYRDGSLTFDLPEGGTLEANFDLKSK